MRESPNDEYHHTRYKTFDDLSDFEKFDVLAKFCYKYKAGSSFKFFLYYGEYLYSGSTWGKQLPKKALDKIEAFDLFEDFPDLNDPSIVDNFINANKSENFVLKFLKPVESRVKTRNLQEYLESDSSDEKQLELCPDSKYHQNIIISSVDQLKNYPKPDEEKFSFAYHSYLLSPNRIIDDSIPIQDGNISLIVNLSKNFIGRDDPHGKVASMPFSHYLTTHFKENKDKDPAEEVSLVAALNLNVLNAVKVVDLSFNFIQKLTSFASMPNLQCAYLHKNLIHQFEELHNFKKNTQLEIITLFYNPLEESENYRLYILYSLNQASLSNIRKIDKSEVTELERDRVMSFFRPKGKEKFLLENLQMDADRLDKYKTFGYPQLQDLSKPADEVYGPLKDYTNKEIRTFANLQYVKPHNNNYVNQNNSNSDEKANEQYHANYLLKFETGKKEDKAIRVFLTDKHKYKEGVTTIIKNNTRRFVSKDSKFTAQTKKSKVKTTEVCPGVKLCYNKLGYDEIMGYLDYMDREKAKEKGGKHTNPPDETHLYMIYEPILSTVGVLENVRTIDLSFNFLRYISKDFARFPHLHTLQLHKNLIYKFDEIYNLMGCAQLKTLTLHNNPIEEYPNYRILVLSKLPQLKKFDSVLFTAVQKDAARLESESGKAKMKGEADQPGLLWRKTDVSAKKVLNLRELVEHYLKFGYPQINEKLENVDDEDD